MNVFCWLWGHPWLPRGPYIADVDGGVQIRHSECFRCGLWYHLPESLWLY